MSNTKINSFFQSIPTWGLYFFTFLIPWQARYFISRATIGGQEWEYGSLSIYLTEVLLLILVIFAFIAHRSNTQEEWHYKGRRAMNVFLLPWFLLIAVIVLSFFSENSQIAWMATWRLFEGVALLYILNELTYSIHTLAWWFTGSAVIQSIMAMVQYFSQQIGGSSLLGMAAKLPGVAGVSVVETAGERFLRAYGTFPHPNILAAFISLALIFSLGLLFAFRNKWERYYVLAVTPILSLGLMLTFSRTGALFMAIALSVIFIYLVTNKMQALFKLACRWLIVFILPILIFAALNQNIFFDHYLSPSIAGSASVTDRLSQYQEARLLIADNWLKGVGMGNYTYAISKLHPDLGGASLQPVHNILLLSLVELGVFGAAIFISLLIEIVKIILRFKANYSQEMLVLFNQFEHGKTLYDKDYGTITIWYVALCGMMIGLLCWFFFDHFFWTLYSGIIMFWFTLGVWLRLLIRTKS